MLDRFRFLTTDLSKRARVALLLTALLVLGLAVYGFICSLRVWVTVFAVLLLLAALFGIGLLLWKYYLRSQREEYRKSAASFLFWFMSKYKEVEPVGGYYRQTRTPIPLKPVHDASEFHRECTVALHKLVAVVEVRLTLDSAPKEKNIENRATMLEWLRDDAKTYDMQHNLTAWGGFSRYYATGVELSGEHLLIRLVVVDNPLAAAYVKKPPETRPPEVSMLDDDFGEPPAPVAEDIPDDDEIL